MSTAVPQQLGGRYEIGDLLGRGGMAEVHIGRDSRLGRSVAVKMLRPDLARDPSFQARFRREAHSAASLNHPAVVAIYDTGEDEHAGNPVPYIVMEYVEGSTLRDLLASGRRLVPERALEIVDGVLAALAYSHQHGIVHRDIKPANVMLTRNGDVKVMDFGIARAVADQSATMTATSAVIGTAQYLSPEQARGEQVDARSDLYSTGCLLYELLTGRPPFVGDSPVSVAYQHVREEPAPPSSLDPDISPAVDALVMRSLTKDREHRYQNADEMRADIRRALSGQAVSGPAPTAVTQRVVPATESTASLPVLPDNGRRDNNRDGRGLAYALLGLAVIAVFVIAAVLGKSLFDSNKTPPVQVPNVQGRTLEQATRTLTTAGLAVGKVTRANDDSTPAGRVFDQTPEPGNELNKGQKVNLSVSLGQKQTTVPNVIGLDLNEATRQLSDNNLRVGQSKPVASGEDRNTVTDVTPNPGKTVPVGSTVDIKYASGQNKVPDVTGKPEAEARSLLEQAGFTVTTENRETPDAPPGTVVDQTPKGKENARLGTTVVIFLATAPPTVPPTPTATPPPTPGVPAG
ncbi:MAG: eukaryotic-like serine/threonine-protein kinase [Actinomycetota bacterium]|nr:eukaryotic-like serine/threonine-protein kinase [Actinomycetota bacterium]